ncbi:MAG: FG-GAP-like repeat-containing protein [Pseudomonadota bacterium]
MSFFSRMMGVAGKRFPTHQSWPLIKRFFLTYLLLAMPVAHADFTLSGELGVTGGKDGGVAFGDYNNDSCTDVLISTQAATSPELHTQSTTMGQCDGTFTLSRSFNESTDRAVIWGDFDNDGLLDFAANQSFTKIIVYRNTNGTAAGFTEVAEFDPGNSEGMAWIDYDSDGDLDLLIDNDDFGMRMYTNVGGTISGASFFDVHTGNIDGDYLAVGDYDLDGDVDFYGRRDGTNDADGEADLWNNTAGTFTRVPTLNLLAPNAEKGGAAFCDLDNDGDLDVVRTNGGPSQAFENTGSGWTARTNFGGDSDDVACADVDNDGDLDVAFNTNAGNAALFLNDGGFVFTANNLNITASGDGEGMAFADPDQDGDMDVLFNLSGTANEYWTNDTDSSDYLVVLPTTSGRPALGATVQLFSCNAGAVGTAVLGSRDISGGTGHGSQNQNVAHFGLSNVGGSDTPFVARTRFIGGTVVDVAVRPNTLAGYQSITVDSTDAADLSACAPGVDGTIDIDDMLTPGDTATITVTDVDLNTDMAVADTVVIDVVNDNTGEFEQVTLTETGADTSVFVGSLSTSDAVGAGTDNDGDINTQTGDTLTASYDDQLDSMGGSTTRTDTATLVALDTDGDGVPDASDEDDDNDGLPDADEVVGDSDMDGIDNSLDIDSDNDGIVDNVEAQTEGGFQAPTGNDNDGDGLDDAYDVDDGGTPIVIVNSDGLDQPDYLDTDSDNDSVPDAVEGHDANGDGVADTSPASNDSDNDGLDDNYDTVAAPANGNSIGSNSPLQDNDGDGTRDWRDVDDDDDTLLTINEDANSNNDPTDDDADGDGTPDYLEASNNDADGDGTNDDMDPNDGDPCVPSQFGTGCTIDTDGDGDPDSDEGETNDGDGDGLPDYTESDDNDGDGDGVNDEDDPSNNDPCVPSQFAMGCTIDTDGDGDPDSDEGETNDGDGDGLPDYTESDDSDADGDGVNDEEDPSNNDPCVPSDTAPGCVMDSDGDGDPDDTDPDPNDPCVPDDTVAACDSDMDGVSDGDENTNGTDPNDSDTDGDGIQDGDENMDADGDGLNDGNDLDSDNDGIPDGEEAGPDPMNPRDTDGDGTPDFFDPDSDNDGIPDAIETNVDSDGDGTDNYLDPDSDDDGIPDAIEDDVSNGDDTDMDGVDDGYDPDNTGGSDTNGDGVDDDLLPEDNDGDLAPNYLDPDSDNDSIPDTVETDLDVNNDADADQINDVYDIDVIGGDDANDDGVEDNGTTTNTDGDGLPDYLDLDSDNDSLPDVREAPGPDSDGDAIVDDPANNQGTITDPVDTDGDGTDDYRDTDSDNDGTNDIDGTPFSIFDNDGDGVVDNNDDNDGDGISDPADLLDDFGTLQDSDFDTLPDETEGTGDTDGDGLPDAEDTDSDNDGIGDQEEAGDDPTNPRDTDGDGIEDFRDTDSDNDGLGDDIEGTGDFNNNGIPDYIDTSGELETAVEGFGGGSTGSLTLLGVLLLVMRKRRRFVLLLPLVLVFSGTTYADSLCGHYTAAEDPSAFYPGEDPGRDNAGYKGCWYGGIGYGYSYVSPDEEANNFFHDASENHDNGINLFIGRQLTPRIFVELKYADLGEAGITNANPAIRAAFPDAAITYEVPSLMAGYQWRPGENFRPFVKAGLSVISNDATGGPVPFDEQTAAQVAFGLGFDAELGGGAGFVRGDADFYDRDAWYMGVSIGRRFGPEGSVLIPKPGDSDRDGVTDDIDQCPDTPPNTPVDSVGCTLDLDGDDDGVLDADDECPNTQPGVPVDEVGCDRDSDNDGVPDHKDECPDTKPDVEVDIKGCEIKEEIRLPGVNFETNSHELAAGADSILDDAAATLLKNPNLVVEVEGHTDDRGEASYNEALSDRRARTVLNYLIGKGVDEDTLTSRGYGESRPIADNGTTEGRHQL